MIKKNLGGDRLGSGAKMDVEMHHYERSTHNLGGIFRTTMSAGTLVPFCKFIALPGDTWDFNLDSDVKTHPTIGPLFGTFKEQLDLFFVPIRLYNGLLHNNLINIGMNMSDIKLPTITLYNDWNSELIEELGLQIDITQINPSSLLAYLGYRGLGVSDQEGTTEIHRTFNAVPILAYYDIFKNYYSNKQEEECYVIHNPLLTPLDNIVTVEANNGTDAIPEYPTVGDVEQDPITGMLMLFTVDDDIQPNENTIIFNTDKGTISLSDILQSWAHPNTNEYMATLNTGPFGDLTFYNWRYTTVWEITQPEPTLRSLDLTNFDDMRRAILSHNDFTAFNINDMSVVPEPYYWLCQKNQNVQPQEGLMVKTYQSDLFNNWIKTETYNTIAAQTAISTAGSQFTIDALRLGKKLNDLLNRVAVAGTTYQDWIETVYTSEIMNMAEIPIYHGGLSKDVVFQEVVATGETQGSEGIVPLGQLAGKGIMGKKHKGGHVVIKPVEPGYIMGIVSLTPRIDYSQGNDFDINLTSVDDLHKPELDQIGFQDLITEQMAWWDTWTNDSEEWVQNSAGKQPAWINYMTNFNKTYGNFAIQANEMFMTLNRQYEAMWESSVAHIKDLTTYIDPKKYNNIFAQTSRDAMNFWVQIAMDIEVRRKMSAKIMPAI